MPQAQQNAATKLNEWLYGMMQETPKASQDKDSVILMPSTFDQLLQTRKENEQ